MHVTSDVVSTLQQLIRLPSVNPMGRDVVGAPYFEHQVTDYLQQFFEELGVAWQRQSIAPWRDNIVARVEGDRSGGADIPVLVWEVHQDTVPVDGMTIDPWEPAVQDGRIYGRGSCDVKGGMACMLTAFARLAREQPPGRSTVILACTVNEEDGFTGAREVAGSWADGTCSLVPHMPQGVIVAEPTSLDVVIAHKGVIRWRCHARGRAAHSSQPQSGENAIHHMAHVVTELEKYASTLTHHPADARLGSPTISVGTIHGGSCVNAVPDLCTIELDRRLLPQEHPQQARQAVIDWLANRLPVAVNSRLQHDSPFLISHGLPDQSTTKLAQQLQHVVRALGPAAELIGVPYGTNAPFFAQLGIPAVVFGPGSIAQAHTADEWVPVDQLRTAVEAYYCSATRPVV